MLPNLTGLTPADIAEFDALIDQMPHGYAKHLSQWLNDKILIQLDRDKQNAAELEALVRQMEADAAAPAGDALDAVIEQFAESSASPPSPETLH